MIDLNEQIKIKWSTRSKQYYEQLGYEYSKIGDEFYVALKDLRKDSSAHVTATCDCDGCSNSQLVPYRNYNKIIDRDGIYKCKKCVGKNNTKERTSKSHERLYNLFLERCEEHGAIPVTQYEDFTGYECDVTFICPTHGETTMSMRRIPQGAWCPKCGIAKRVEASKLSQDEVKRFIESKNNNVLLNPEDYINSSTKNLKVMCGSCQRIHLVSYSSIRNSNGMCIDCGLEVTAAKQREKNIQYYYVFKNICEEMGYKLLSSEDEYENCYTKLRFICPKHGEQAVSYAKFSSGQRCPLCGREAIADFHRLTPSDVKKRINAVNGNVLLNPEEYIGNSELNLKIRCSCGNVYKTSLVCYESGTNRCPTCAKSESRGEFIIRKYLEKINIEFVPQYKFDDCRDLRPLPFDFYLPSYNLIIEFDGLHHFMPVYGQEQFEYTQRHDQMKNAYCLDNGIDLLRIPYWESNHISDILNNKLNIPPDK